MFDTEMCHGMSERQIQQRRNSHFVEWIQSFVAVAGSQIDPRIRALVVGPSMTVRVRKGYIINGFRFHTHSHAATKQTNNWGVYVKGGTDNNAENNYYGKLQEVIELSYWGTGSRLTTTVFKCDWFNLNRGRRVHAKYGLVDINPELRLATNDTEPFILATQAQQCCYFPYPLQQTTGRRPNWWAVCTMRARYIIDVSSQSSAVQVSREPIEVYQDTCPPGFELVVDLSGFDMINLADADQPPEPVNIEDDDEEVNDEDDDEEGSGDEDDDEEEDDPDYS